MTRNLQLGPGVKVPREVGTQTLAIFGMRRSGKSNAGVVLAEEMHRAGIPWVAIDPKGDWWGIRAAGEGGPGLPVPIFGGWHGDLPLPAESGRLMADLVVDTNLTCVFDISRLSKGGRRRFLTEFAEQLMDRHAQDPHVRHVIAEECQQYIMQSLPQEGRSDWSAARCLGIWQDVVLMGGQRGIGITMLSQRVANVNASCRNQAETLIVLRTGGGLDRKAIEDWIKYHDASREIVDSLPLLDDGCAWLLSPHWLKTMEQFTFRRRHTHDSGATPTLGERRKATTLADVDLAGLEQQLADVVEQVERDDPAKLRKKLTDASAESNALGATVKSLQERLDAAHEQIEHLRSQPPEVERVEVVPPEVAELAVTAGKMADALDVFMPVVEKLPAILNLSKACRGYAGRLTDAAGREPVTTVTEKLREFPREIAPKAAYKPTVPADKIRIPDSGTPDLDVPLEDGARRILETMVSRWPRKLSLAQLGTLARFSPAGGAFQKHWRSLRNAGLADVEGTFRVPTPAGIELIGHVAPTSPAEVLAHWRSVLDPASRALLDDLIENGPAADWPALADRTGRTASGGSFQAASRDLRRNQLVTEDGRIAAVPELTGAG